MRGADTIEEKQTGYYKQRVGWSDFYQKKHAVPKCFRTPIPTFHFYVAFTVTWRSDSENFDCYSKIRQKFLQTLF